MSPAASPIPQRARFLACALAQMGSPYIYGAKGRLVRIGLRVFDCSGLFTWAFREVGGPDWTQSHNTDRIWDDCKPVTAARAGTLVLYGKRADPKAGTKVNPEHVMIYLGAGVVFGASGGDHTTLTLADAAAVDARVKPHASYLDRHDCLGFREIPFSDE